MSAHVHTCLAHVCMSGLFAIVLSLAFSHPRPPPIVTHLYPLFLFCFLAFSLPCSFFDLPQLIFCTCCLAPLCCSMEPSWVVMRRLSQRKRAATSNLCHLIILLHRVWIDFATAHFHSVFIIVLKRQSVCACRIVCVCYLVSVSLSSDFMLYFRLCQNVVAILGLNSPCFRVFLQTFLHLFRFFTYIWF